MAQELNELKDSFKQTLLNDICNTLNADEGYGKITFEVEDNRIRVSTEMDDYFLYWKDAPEHQYDPYGQTIARLRLMGAKDSFIKKVNSYLHTPTEQLKMF